MSEKNDNVLNGLISLGCNVKNVDGTILVSTPDNYADFVYERTGAWLTLLTTFIEPDEFIDSEFIGALERFLLEIQHRNLGCRFSYDEGRFLALGAEVYPNQQNPETVLQVLEQISYVFHVCFPMCKQILKTGKILTDKEIDRAFGFE